ncbi:DHH family phosphoesterase [Paenibacillus pabuli]|uniref:DHH family phosphoesterase n=1 Tax=Paenibacillus pabuli TaxID=1472 RepID=UPI003241F0FA
MFTQVESVKPLKEYIAERSEGLTEDLRVYALPYEEQAINMMRRHLLSGSHFGILFDVDVDGLASGLIMYEFLGELEETPKTFMNIDKEHGLNDAITAEIIQSGIDILVIVDAGSSDIHHIKQINNAGIEVLVLDHHEIEGNDEFVGAHHVIVNVCMGENTELSAGGVVFKFIERLTAAMGMDYTLRNRHLNWAGLSVISDSCSLLNDENRYMARHLSENFRQEQIFGLPKYYGSPRSLFSFQVIPMLNAQIRMNQTKRAIQMVLERSKRRLTDLWDQGTETLNEARSLVDSNIKNGRVTKNANFTIAQITHGTLSGLIANKLVKERGVPAIAIYRSKTGTIRGSFRGPGTHHYLDYFQERGIWAKGHQAAFGLQFTDAEFEMIADLYNSFPSYPPSPEIILNTDNLTETFTYMRDMARFNELADHRLQPFLLKVNLQAPQMSVYGKLKTIIDGPWEIKDFTEKPLTRTIIVKPCLDNSILGYQLLRDR